MSTFYDPVRCPDCGKEVPHWVSGYACPCQVKKMRGHMTPADKTEVPVPRDVPAWIRDAAEEVAYHFTDCTKPRYVEEAIAIIARSFSRHAPKDSWQDISTAPKDGTRVLLSYEGHYKRIIGRWCDDSYSKKPRPYWRTEGPWSISADRSYQPTHWQPIPAAPADKQEGAGSL